LVADGREVRTLATVRLEFTKPGTTLAYIRARVEAVERKTGRYAQVEWITDGEQRTIIGLAVSVEVTNEGT